MYEKLTAWIFLINIITVLAFIPDNPNVFHFFNPVALWIIPFSLQDCGL